jgi:hypothetical protein
MSKREVPVKVTLDIGGQKYGMVLTHDLSGAGFGADPTPKFAAEVGHMVAMTIKDHFSGGV